MFEQYPYFIVTKDMFIFEFNFTDNKVARGELYILTFVEKDKFVPPITVCIKIHLDTPHALQNVIHGMGLHQVDLIYFWGEFLYHVFLKIASVKIKTVLD